MKYTLLLSIVLLVAAAVDARITIRHRRQVEREDGSSESGDKLPASEVVVIKDTVNPRLPGPLFLVPRLPGPGDAFDLDINEQDGTFTFGGMLPPHMHHFHAMQRQSFGDLFEAIQRRFDEMTRNMMSFNNFGPGFNPSTDIASLPDDYNRTDTEIVELGGRRYVKKTTTLKKGGPGSSFFVRSTTFEPVDENENVDTPTKEQEEGKKEDVVPDESQPSSTSTSTTTAAPDAKEGPVVESESSPKDESEPIPVSDGPDVVPSSASSESPVEQPAEPEAEERERESLVSSSTEQPSA